MKKIRNIYIHIPFCLKKCSFCDFAVYAIGSKQPNKSFFDSKTSADYVSNLIAEIEFMGSYYKDKFNFKESLKSIYFGGGTPTLLETQYFEAILNTLSKYFKFNKQDTEISLESDPNTFDSAKLENLYDLSFNRITMGVQSLDERVFKHLNRSHTLKNSIESIEVIKNSPFSNNFGLDLIQGLPEQSLESSMSDLSTLNKYQVPHLSIYMLTLEKNSSLFKKYKKEYFTESKQGEISDMFCASHNYLEANNYEHYEISNFSKKGKNSVHNKAYWDGFSEYYGFGSSASSYFLGMRFKKPNSIVKYYDYVSKTNNNPSYFEAFINENDENMDTEVVGKNIHNKNNNNKSDFDISHSQIIELKYLLMNQIRRKEGINLLEVKSNFGIKYYEKIKSFFLAHAYNMNSISDKIINLEQYNNCETINIKFPEGILISDEILINLFYCLEQ